MAANLCDFYDLLNNFLGGIFRRLLCMYVYVCAYRVKGGGFDKSGKWEIC